jgi:hypothetical protein
MYFSMGESGRRHKWTVKVAAKQLTSCCSERMVYHEGRINFWKTELDASETKLRTEGIQLKHYEVTGGRRTEAQLDSSLSGRVGECQQRLKSNRDAYDHFAAYYAMFKLAGDSEFELNCDDVLYFNLEGADCQSSQD